MWENVLTVLFCDVICSELDQEVLAEQRRMVADDDSNFLEPLDGGLNDAAYLDLVSSFMEFDD